MTQPNADSKNHTAQRNAKHNGIQPNKQDIPARIIAVHKERYTLICEHGEVSGLLKKKEYYQDGEVFPTVGDFVLIRYVENGECWIVKTLPRKTFFSRRDPTLGRGEQAVAANFDYVFLLQSLNLDFNEKRLERYLTLAWQSGAKPVVILTKQDQCDDVTQYLERAEVVAKEVPIIAISAHTGAGLAELDPYLKPGNTIVFLGSSGVGKSSLVNALATQDIMDVKGIREDDSRGRHTTTHRQLIQLPSGVMVIDTPGMRELGMWYIADGIQSAFSDVEAFLGKCKFSDCKHQSEPGCAIQRALQNKELSPARWESYQALQKESKYADDRSSYFREREAWRKEVSKTVKTMKKGKRGR